MVRWAEMGQKCKMDKNLLREKSCQQTKRVPRGSHAPADVILEQFPLAYAFGIGSGNTGCEEKGGEDAWESFLSRSSSSSSCLIRLVKVEGRYAL